MPAARYNIQDLPHGLRIRVTQELEFWERLLTAVVPGLFAAIAGSMFLKSEWWLGTSFLIATVIFLFARTRGAELIVSQFEFVAKGALGRRVQTPRVLMAAHIRKLEFQENSISGKSGLYAWTGNNWKLLLPFLDWQQTQEILEAIKKKLPGLAESWH